ncbi:accessory Sec system translocase SecA2 [Dethiothermospora halolimnae]|uniref:accessory Sec system translocase SecA2 n=1 Tax=Dethiothermospora halolimnae TaxID=3114390 RepID=UPI003CCBB166
MFKLFKKKVSRKMNDSVEYKLDMYKEILRDIKNIDYKSYSDKELKEISMNLREQAINGMDLDKLLVEAFALVMEAIRRTLDIEPYDVQVIGAIGLHMGKVIEMKTGEGKTLSAVMPAYLNALTNKGVHILTFNDYLAKRDGKWMGPVYEFLGLTTGYINEGMDIEERQRAYLCDITYVTAKEAGFDYLRDFLCYEKEKLCHRSLNYVIVDEADSILIDEARIPLVIAGNVDEKESNLLYLSKLVKKLKINIHYEISENGRNVSLTEEGLLYAEKSLGCRNLYEEGNLELLTRLNSALHSEVLLVKDRDYIVRNKRIEIIDEHTGRIAEKRHWPDNLQIAVEAKEGIISKSKGKILGSIALQHFIVLYNKVSGMTGTAKSVAKEFDEFYGIKTLIVPTNRNYIRKDYPDVIFTHKEAKEEAIVLEISKIHKRGQPILIGTSSVEESEKLGEKLRKVGIDCNILNAKNDEMEAEIIANAGKLKAVTVSTNMAGRGVDIRLGGMSQEERKKVIALGGLYVIGTNRHESIRIDNQLKGRAGRQGDPGESKFFISLEDDIIKKYDITNLIPKKHLPKKQQEPINDSPIEKAIELGQRIVKGYNSDLRRQLWKYSNIIEEQRKIIHKKRQDILLDNEIPTFLALRAKKRYDEILKKQGKKLLEKIQKQITLYYINKSWEDYLDYIEYVKEGIHLVSIGKIDPLDEFHKRAIEAFDNMLDTLEDQIVEKFNDVEISENGIDIDKEGLKGPSSTWTYLMDDNPNKFSHIQFVVKTIDKLRKKFN